MIILFGIYLIVGLVILLIEIRLGRTRITRLKDLSSMIGFVILAPLYSIIIGLLRLRKSMRLKINKRRGK